MSFQGVPVFTGLAGHFCRRMFPKGLQYISLFGNPIFRSQPTSEKDTSRTGEMLPEIKLYDPFYIVVVFHKIPCFIIESAYDGNTHNRIYTFFQLFFFIYCRSDVSVICFWQCRDHIRQDRTYSRQRRIYTRQREKQITLASGHQKTSMRTAVQACMTKNR